LKSAMNNQERQIIRDIYSQLVTVVNSTYEKFADRVLLTNGDGIVIFNRYFIRQAESGVELVFRNSGNVLQFSSSKIALVYSILDFYNQIMAAKHLLELDRLLSGIEINIKIHRKLKSRGDIDQHIIYHSKLQHDLDRKRQIREEIDKYSILAQQCYKLRNKT